jgi:hypothetical protein
MCRHRNQEIVMSTRILRVVLISVAASFGVLACAERNSPVEPVPLTGALTGTITLLGSVGVAPSGRVALYPSLADFEQRRAAYDGALTRVTGYERMYTFQLDSVHAGGYYLTACWVFGCGEYRDKETGALLTTVVVAGQRTHLTVDF